jgi:hypothetical protein
VPAAGSPEQIDRAVEQAGADAVAAALPHVGLKLEGRVVHAVSREGLERSAPADLDAAAFLRAALSGKVTRGYAVLGGKLYLAAAVPAGDRGAVAVFAPADVAWVKNVAGQAGEQPEDTRLRNPIAVVLTAPKAGIVSNAPADSEALSAMAARAMGTKPSDSTARLPPVDVTPSWLPVKIPAVGSLVGPAPADRVSSRALPGVDGGTMVVAAATAPALEPVLRFEWYALACLALALLLAIPFSLLVKPSEVTAALPPILVDAARRIERGDFTVRAPILAGKLGTIAAALNKAMDAIQPGNTAVSSVTSEFYARAPAPASAPAPAEGSDLFTGRAGLSTPAAEPRPEPARFDGADLSGSAFEAAPVPVAKPAPAPARPAPAPAAARPAVSAAPAPAGDLLAGAARAAPAGDAGDEEQHWREVFRDFVRTRAECGESAEGLTYERFRQKLESNKGALVSKYGCKTVRFQVYVKDGKAALKATPVR